jgi:hypothetical protein
MKTPLKLCLVAYILLMLQSCMEEQKLGHEKVKIKFSLASGSDGSSTKGIPDGSSLMINVETGSGEPVLENKTITFTKEGSTYVTESLDLPPGNYVITDFMMLDGNDEVQFAVPRIDAPLASDVVHPLMHNFKISTHGVSEITMELLEVGRHAAKEFGYASFFGQLYKTFSIVVFTKDSTRSRLAPGDAFILDGNDTLRAYELRARINLVTFNGDPEKEYTLVVIKDGYSRYARQFTLKSLWMELHGKPIKAVLTPALTIVGVTDATGYFGFELDGFPGTLTIDWGDGTSQTEVLADPTAVDIVQQHTYAAPGKYFISITGDLDKIFMLYFGQGGGPSATDRVNIDRLSELQDLRFTFTHAPRVVDASHNHKLWFLIFWNTDVRRIKISREKPPINIELEGSGHISSEAFGSIIDVAHDYALRMGESAVRFISWHYTPDPSNPSETVPIGPPTPQTYEKMRTLQNVYGVEFGPAVE